MISLIGFTTSTFPEIMSSKRRTHLSNDEQEKVFPTSHRTVPLCTSPPPVEPTFQSSIASSSNSNPSAITNTDSNTASTETIINGNGDSICTRQSHIYLNGDDQYANNRLIARKKMHSSPTKNGHNLTSNKKSSPQPSSSSSSSSQPSKDFKGGKDAWQSMLYNLLAYKVNHNNETNVKFETENTQEHSLYLWLQNQRKHYKYFIDGRQSFLNEERVKILESVGVEWNVRGEVFWENMYEKLKEYKSTYGDTLVPRKWEENKKLGEWVTDQRRQHKYKITNKSSLLTDERERKLNEIGFIWSLRNRTDWNQRFEELVKFKQEYGHCVVPQLFEQNKALGKWVSKQREQYRRLLHNKYSFMTTERVGKLNDIGFSWNAKGRRNIETLVGTEIEKSTLTNRPSIVEASANNFDGKTSMPLLNNDNLGEKSVTPASQRTETHDDYYNQL